MAWGSPRVARLLSTRVKKIDILDANLTMPGHPAGAAEAMINLLFRPAFAACAVEPEKRILRARGISPIRRGEGAGIVSKIPTSRQRAVLR